jgi:GNAT superfamily N-acetyltransferase
MVLACARELFCDLWDEMQPLLVENQAETGDPDMVLSPNVLHYATLEAGNILRVYTVRADGELVGYAFFCTMPSPHYHGSRQAFHDTTFVRKEWRSKGAGLRLLRFVEEQLADDGCEVMYQTVTPHHDHSKVLLRRGYKLYDTVYGKRLRPKEQ